MISLTRNGTVICSAISCGITTSVLSIIPLPPITVLELLNTRIELTDYLNKPYFVIAAENKLHGSAIFYLLDMNLSI